MNTPPASATLSPQVTDPTLPSVAPSSQNGTDALRCLNAAIDERWAHGEGRKAIADDLGITAYTLSKMTSGVQAFGVSLFDRMPDDLLAAFLTRYGVERGFELRWISPVEVDTALLESLDRLLALARLRKVRTRSAKAGLPAGIADRRRA